MKNLIPDSVSEHTNVYDVLMERGLIEQTTNGEALRELLGKEKIKFYIGFDPTADCLHVGHFIPMITMMYMQKYGHTPVFLLGGGTGEIGDPSGRSDMRQVMTIDTIDYNCRQFKKDSSRNCLKDSSISMMTGNTKATKAFISLVIRTESLSLAMQ